MAVSRRSTRSVAKAASGGINPEQLTPPIPIEPRSRQVASSPSAGQCPKGVILDVLDAPRTLLVYLDNRTSTSISGTSESCQRPTWRQWDVFSHPPPSVNVPV